MPAILKNLFVIFVFYFSLHPVHVQAKNPLTLPVYGNVKDFSFKERSGRRMGLKDFKGNPWIIDFIFTRCAGPCPVLTSHMARLQKKLPAKISLVSLTVDPGHDTPQILSKYARKNGVRKKNWFFLTGKKKKIYDLIHNSFHLGVTKDNTTRNPGYGFIHSTRFVLVDAKGNIRNYYDGLDPDPMDNIIQDTRILLLERSNPFILTLPGWNAVLNSLSALFLVAGYFLIRKKNIFWHRWLMSSAFTASGLFLINSLTCRYYLGSIPFSGRGWSRFFYFLIVSSRNVLAVLAVPLVFIALYRAWKGDWIRHKQIARWTWPLWLAASLSGVMVYWMIYQ